MTATAMYTQSLSNQVMMGQPDTCGMVGELVRLVDGHLSEAKIVEMEYFNLHDEGLDLKCGQWLVFAAIC